MVSNSATRFATGSEAAASSCSSPAISSPPARAETRPLSIPLRSEDTASVTAAEMPACAACAGEVVETAPAWLDAAFWAPPMTEHALAAMATSKTPATSQLRRARRPSRRNTFPGIGTFSTPGRAHPSGGLGPATESQNLSHGVPSPPRTVQRYLPPRPLRVTTLPLKCASSPRRRLSGLVRRLFRGLGPLRLPRGLGPLRLPRGLGPLRLRAPGAAAALKNGPWPRCAQKRALAQWRPASKVMTISVVATVLGEGRSRPTPCDGLVKPR
jgi:hypothetical protein